MNNNSASDNAVSSTKLKVHGAVGRVDETDIASEVAHPLTLDLSGIRCPSTHFGAIVP